MADTTTTTIPAWTLGDRLRKAREAAGMSTQQMADALARSRNTIGNWEAGRTQPTDRVLARWAQITGVPIAWLRGDQSPTRGDVTGRDNSQVLHAGQMHSLMAA